jgi:hypothetical protein
MLGKEFLNSSALVFTRWGQSKKEKAVRQRQNDSEEIRAREFNGHIKRFTGFDTDSRPLPAFFIDNMLPEGVEGEFDDFEKAYFK